MLFRRLKEGTICRLSYIHLYTFIVTLYSSKSLLPLIFILSLSSYPSVNLSSFILNTIRIMENKPPQNPAYMDFAAGYSHNSRNLVLFLLECLERMFLECRFKQLGKSFGRAGKAGNIKSRRLICQSRIIHRLSAV